MIQNALGVFTIPFSIFLIGFLAYGSQILFYFIDPGPLDFRQSLSFNCLVVFIYTGYLKSCFTNPGWVPKGWTEAGQAPNSTQKAKSRWCKKCEAFKPHRAHHCKTCARCVPKMDHHCPWTASCVSNRTIPDFCRFLFYSVVTMSYLTKLLYARVLCIWNARELPSVGWKEYLKVWRILIANVAVSRAVSRESRVSIRPLLYKFHDPFRCRIASHTKFVGFE